MDKWEVEESQLYVNTGYLTRDGARITDKMYASDANEIARKLNAFPEMLAALKEYQDHRNWSWNGGSWQWNGARSSTFTGDPNEGNGYPSQDKVDAECGSIAKSAIENAESTNV